MFLFMRHAVGVYIYEGVGQEEEYVKDSHEMSAHYSFVAERFKIHSLWPRRSRGFKL